jgi:hypothetical protein
MLVEDADRGTQTKTNRPEGHFATGDLYLKHSTIPNAWKYLGRKDDMLVLVSGKKADPLPLETALASVPGITDAAVFGAGRAYLGILLVPSQDNAIDDTEKIVWSVVEKINADASPHQRVPREMLVLLPSSTVFPRTAKGTMQRTLVFKQQEDAISNAYDAFERGSTGVKKVITNEEKMVEYVTSVVSSITDKMFNHDGLRGLDPDTDLFSWGVDSIQAARIRNRLQSELELGQAGDLDPNVVYERRTIGRLARHLFNLSKGGQGSEDEPEDIEKLMWEMVERYGKWQDMAGLRLDGVNYADGKDSEGVLVSIL